MQVNMDPLMPVAENPKMVELGRRDSWLTASAPWPHSYPLNIIHVLIDNLAETLRISHSSIHGPSHHPVYEKEC